MSHGTVDARAAALAASELLPEIFAHVVAAYPHEGCGFVFLDGEGRLVHLPTANRAAQLHAKDPERYPRGGADWFEPDMKPWLRAQREGLTPWLIYHSHPDDGAYFSDSDVESAVVADDNGSVVERNPGVDHMVVSVRGARAEGARLFRFDVDARRFVDVAALGADGALVAAPPESSGGSQV